MSVHKVVYKGLSDVRRMSKKDLKEVGISVESELVWDKRRSRVPAVFIADITDALMEVFKAEGTFTVTEVDEETMREVGGEPIVVGEAIDDTGSVVRDGVTGQTTSKGDKNANADPVPSGGDGAGAGSAKGRTGRGSSTTGSTT